MDRPVRRLAQPFSMVARGVIDDRHHSSGGAKPASVRGPERLQAPFAPRTTNAARFSTESKRPTVQRRTQRLVSPRSDCKNGRQGQGPRIPGPKRRRRRGAVSLRPHGAARSLRPQHGHPLIATTHVDVLDQTCQRVRGIPADWLRASDNAAISIAWLRASSASISYRAASDFGFTCILRGGAGS